MISHFPDSLDSFIGYGIGILLIIGLILELTYKLRKNEPQKTQRTQRTANRHFSRDEILEDIIAAFEKSKVKAREFADDKLEDWVKSLEPNVEDFLTDHFDYFYQKKIGLISIASKKILQNEVAEKIERDIFSPTQIERKMENILIQTVDAYALDLAKRFVEIQNKYQLSAVEWKEFSVELRQLTFEKGGRIYQFDKIAYWLEKGCTDFALTGGVYGMKAIISSPNFVDFIGKQAAGLLTKLGLKSVIKVGLGKAITSFAAKLAAGWIAAFLIVVSDIWSHNSSVCKQKPKLKKALLDQIREIKIALLEGHEYSIMSAITQIEYETVKISKEKEIVQPEQQITLQTTFSN
jgi:hypothetical protein